MPWYELLLLFRTVSAPGKVLIAGGYLVLDRPNVGVVLAATARFFTSVKWTEEEVRVLIYCTSRMVLIWVVQGGSAPRAAPVAPRLTMLLDAR